MTDRYIDQDETQIYGAHAVAKMRGVVSGKLPDLDAAVEYVAAHLESATQAIGAAIGDARDGDGNKRESTRTKAPVLTDALAFLGRFSSHLDAQPQADRVRYFGPAGTVTSIGRAGPRVLLAVQNIATQLAKSDAGVTAAADWAAQASALATSLATSLQHASSARTARRELTPGVENLRAAWLLAYGVAKKQCLVVLELSGHADLLSEVFYDLQVAGDAKVSVIPPGPKPEPIA